MKLTDADKLGMTPDEIAILEADTGDESSLDAPSSQNPADESASAADDAGSDGADSGAEAADGAAEEAGDKAPAAEAQAEAQVKPEAQPAELPKYNVPEGDFDAKLKDVRAQLRQAHQDWDDGKIEDDVYRKMVDDLEASKDALLVEQTRAQTIAELNEQHKRAAIQARQNAEDSAMRALAEKCKGSAVDYTKDKTATKQFDIAYQGLAVDPDNAELSIPQLVQKAHEAVLAMRGKSPAPAQQQQADKPSTRQGVPNTLAGVPPASRPSTGSDPELERFMSLSGEDAEFYLASLSPAKVEALMRRVDRAAASA